MTRAGWKTDRPRPSEPFLGPIFLYIIVLSTSAGVVAWILR